MESSDRVDGFEHALAGITTCGLDGDARRRQKARYEQVTQAMARVSREPQVVLVDFHPHVDPAVVHDLIAAERDCCPWLSFRWDGPARRLSVTVADSCMLPALEAIHSGFIAALP